MIHTFEPAFAGSCDWCRMIHQSTHHEPGEALVHAVACGWVFDGERLACPRCAHQRRARRKTSTKPGCPVCGGAPGGVNPDGVCDPCQVQVGVR